MCMSIFYLGEKREGVGYILRKVVLEASVEKTAEVKIKKPVTTLMPYLM